MALFNDLIESILLTRDKHFNAFGAEPDLVVQISNEFDRAILGPIAVSPSNELPPHVMGCPIEYVDMPINVVYRIIVVEDVKHRGPSINIEWEKYNGSGSVAYGKCHLTPGQCSSLPAGAKIIKVEVSEP